MTDAHPTPVFAVRLEAVLRVKPFVSKEAARYYLNGVCIEPAAEGGAVCVATDGHRLGVRYDRQGWSAGPSIVAIPPEIKMPSKGSLIISPWLVGVQTAPGKGHISVVEAASGPREEDTPEAAIARVEECIFRVGRTFIDGTFPDWRRVIPAMTDKDAVRGFNGDYIKGFGKQMEIRGADSSAPHLIQVDGEPDFLGVLMPMRTNGKDKLPDWLARPEAPAEQKRAA